MIPKPDGSQRELGIPTVTDRLIQQALLQVLQPLLDPTFSEHSYGFRPGRRAHDAVLAAQSYIQSGRRIVVDVDLEKFFDRVNHDILIDRLRKRIPDAEVIRLIRAYLNSGIIKRRVATKALATFKQRVRQLTRRSGGRSMQQVVDRLRVYLLGWKGYFRLSQTPRVWRTLDEWMRHRLRAIQLKQWKRGKTIFRELYAMGASVTVAQRVAGNSRRWWRNSAKLLNSVLSLAWFDRLGMPRLS